MSSFDFLQRWNFFSVLPLIFNFITGFSVDGLSFDEDVAIDKSQYFIASETWQTENSKKRLRKQTSVFNIKIFQKKSA